MTFSNSTIDISASSIDELRLQAISPRYRVINIAITVFLMVLAMLAVTLVKFELIFSNEVWVIENAIWLYFAAGTVGMLFVLYHFFADPIIQYAIREHDVHFQAGLFFRKLTSQPILRVQHIELKRGPIERKAGLATLQVFSAGGSAHTFEIRGLEYEKAIALRQFIINHSDLAIDE